MKLHGETLSIPNLKVIPIIRDSGNIILKAAPIQSFDDFDKIYPVPEPPVRELPGGKVVALIESKEYKDMLAKRNRLMTDYMVLKSLEATEELEWETVDLNDPETYGNYATEMQAAGFTAVEITRVVNEVLAANSLDEEIINKARESFLAGVPAQAEQE